MFGSKSGGREGRLVDTLIGPQVGIRGDLVFTGKLYVEGRIHGKVLAEEGQPATLTLSGAGCIEGEIHAPVVIIDGEVVGNIHASERVELTAHARVHGDIHYSVVEMSAGAQLTGRLIHADAVAALAGPPGLVATVVAGT